MQIVADLHVHSRYSRAVSQKMDLHEIAQWCKRKGVDLVATADWTHPVWLKELNLKLKEKRQGIYQLEDEPDVSFIISTELACIYSQDGKTRRIHVVVFSPSLATCAKVVKELQKRGAKLMADGRPMLGMSAKELIEMLLAIDKNILLIPAHIWTPWFSLYGSFSGFDSVDECFGDYAKYIYGIETGLSSDPIMNWQIKELENRSIVSFSDAHSGPKIGREATVFVSKTAHDFTYNDIVNTIKQKADSKFKIGYTIEFFPEEGKYHWSGHRACGIRYSPQDVKTKGMLCPVCHRKLTIGVENRVLDLGHKEPGDQKLHLVKNSAGTTFVYDLNKKRVPFVSLIPLLEVLQEINNNSPIRGLRAYEELTASFGTEFDILMKKPYQEIKQAGGEKLEQAIRLVRERRVFVDPGFDGVFGKVKIFTPENSEQANQKEEADQESQLGLF